MMKWFKSLIRRFSLKGVISQQQAEDNALKRVPGQILKVTMKYDDGILFYKILILTPENKIFEVILLANDGRILKVEKEGDFD